MILTRTPLRVSLLGGGTDYPSWYAENEGLVLGGAITQYVYIHVRRLPGYHRHRTRVVYSRVEEVESNDRVEHPAVRACLDEAGLGGPGGPGLELFHAADLPAGSGTGSSSSFVVGLLNALWALQGRRVDPYGLAAAAVAVEQSRLGETVGVQDQTLAAHGGLNVLRVRRGGRVDVLPLCLSGWEVAALEAHLLLFFSGQSRHSSQVAARYAGGLAGRAREQHALVRAAEEGLRAVARRDYETLGVLVDRSYRVKASLDPAVTTERLAELYAAARLHGAWGGKVTGAGGGGCLLLVAPPEKHAGIVAALSGQGATHVPFRFDHCGSSVVFSDLRGSS